MLPSAPGPDAHGGPNRFDPGNGDGWVEASDGRRFWGRFGAAGLLLIDPDDRVLLQHRASWSHFGDTWGLPGGARHGDETAAQGALRESAEEAGVPPELVRVVAETVLDLGIWSYTTVVARAVRGFDAVIGDAESRELRWVPRPEVAGLPLHPGFGGAWPELSSLIDSVPTLVVDAANVIGSRPNGWWKDRAGATERLVERILASLDRGFDAARLLALGTDGESAGRERSASTSDVDHPVEPVNADDTEQPVDPRSASAVSSTAEALAHEPVVTLIRPDVVVVIEGLARDASLDVDGYPLSVVRAEGSGDDAVVEAVAGLVGRKTSRIVVVTADRALRGRVEALGAVAAGPGAFEALIPQA